MLKIVNCLQAIQILAVGLAVVSTVKFTVVEKENPLFAERVLFEVTRFCNYSLLKIVLL